MLTIVAHGRGKRLGARFVEEGRGESKRHRGHIITPIFAFFSLHKLHQKVF